MTPEELQQAAARGAWLITYFCSERVDLDDALVDAAEQGEDHLKAFIDAQVGGADMTPPHHWLRQAAIMQAIFEGNHMQNSIKWTAADEAALRELEQRRKLFNDVQLPRLVDTLKRTFRGKPHADLITLAFVLSQNAHDVRDALKPFDSDVKPCPTVGASMTPTQREALAEAEATFRRYGDLHAAKPDPVKASANYELADRMAAALDAPAVESSCRTDQQIVDQTEELAKFLLFWKYAYEPENETLMREAIHPKAEDSWQAACRVQEMLTDTDPMNAVAEVDDELAPVHGPDYKQAFDVWQDKTEWVQETAKPHELGMHRGDVLRQRIEALERLREGGYLSAQVQEPDRKPRKEIP